ncbi:Hsp20/alpha crystallin family protein [Streptosporangium sandarakinum]|uniref:Hsp20/alpha crystallin family protein n=1 Tax=Streptosporangium sandarakinum TaxID=1260955 RepID=UPI0033AD63CD
MSMLMRQERGLFPELLDWLDAPLAATRTQGQGIRFEDYMHGDRYVLRAELPGIEPEDIEIDVNNGVLTVHAERRIEEKERHRTEFRYGSFTRSIALPPTADEKDVEAVYDKGVLEISLKLSAPEEKSRRIPVHAKKAVQAKAQTGKQTGKR